MSRNARIWIVALVALAVFVIVAWFLGSAVGSRTWEVWVVRALLWVLGVVVTVLLVGVAKKAGVGELTPAAEDLEKTFKAARDRLRSAGNSLAGLPMVVVVGPQGSTKTTSVLRSDLEPALLAGDVFRGQEVTPTGSANIWFAHNTVIVEAGGKALGDPSLWARTIRHLQPRKLKALLGGGPPAPRVAVVCFSCEELVKPGGQEASVRSAQVLRKRITDMARRLGIRLPVYVMFTKADRLPYFADYVSRFAESEVGEIMGATLPMVPAAASGSYADQEHQRLNRAFVRIVEALAARRVEVLAREGDPTTQAGAYEFPRELRKAVPAAIAFLVELCKPTQLSVSPFLRGFYFTGVRAILRGDAAPPPTPAAGTSGSMGATNVFDSRRAVAQASSPSAPRRAPQWVFVSRLFREVILRDRVALGMVNAGGPLMMMRRGLVAGGLALSVILTLAFTVSFFSNQRLTSRVLNNANALAGVVSSEPDLPDVETLRRLEGLRQQVERLIDYQDGGRPWRMRWWMYRGEALIGPATAFYVGRMETVLLRSARQSLEGALAGIGATSEASPVREALKAYLMVTKNPEQLDSTFLTPVVTDRWLRGRDADSERLDLARRQFAFYHRLCAHYEGCARPAAEPIVLAAQRFLAGFSGADAIYASMLARANEVNPAIRFAERVPGSAAYVVNDYEISGAFTPGGWAFMQNALANISAYLGQEAWVMGEYEVDRQDEDALVDEIGQLYRGQYVQRWKQFLAASSIAAYTNVRDAATKLEQLAGNQSALLALVQVISDATNVDPGIAQVFQPVHFVVPPDTNTLTVESNAPYTQGLLDLRASVANVADGAPGEESNPLKEAARQNAQQARNAVAQVARGFVLDGEAREVGTALQGLLTEPISAANRFLQPIVVQAGAGLRGRVATFCGQFNAQMRKFPFNPSATEEASLEEFTDLFHPASGRVAGLIQGDLAEIVESRPTGVQARAGARPAPTRALLDFLTESMRVGATLWPPGQTDPLYRFLINFETTDALPGITLRAGGVNILHERNQRRNTPVTWNRGVNQAILAGQIANRNETLKTYNGQWALFRLFYDATWQGSGATYRVSWDIPRAGAPVTVSADVTLTGPVRVLDRNYFSTISCPSQAF